MSVSTVGPKPPVVFAGKGGSSGQFWALLPVLLLGSMVLGLGAIVVLYVNDPSLALEEDYYKKAVGWDQRQALERSNRALGYKLRVEAKPLLRGARAFELQVEPRDRADVPLTQAVVQVEAFPNAQASRIFRGTLRPSGNGQFVVNIPGVRTGLWEFRVALENGKERYTEVFRRDVVAGP